MTAYFHVVPRLNSNGFIPSRRALERLYLYLFSCRITTTTPLTGDSLPLIYHLVPMLRIRGASLPRPLQAFPLPVSHLQKSALSCRSVMPPYTHMASSCSIDECLWRAGGRSPWQPALDLPHVPMLGDDSMCHDSVSAGINQPIYLITWLIHLVNLFHLRN